jgi:DNA-binding transcriptional LysR family regulator
MIVSDRAAGLATGECDLLIKIGPLKDSSQISRKILTFRNRLLASPAYLANRKAPETPNELLGHRLLALSCCEPEIKWSFMKSDHKSPIVLTIEPHLSVNDPTSLARALLAGMGIGNLPSMAAGELLLKGQLIELMPQWRFDTIDVSVVYPGSRYVRRPVQEFVRFAAKLAPSLCLPRQGIEPASHKQDDLSVLDARAIL